MTVVGTLVVSALGGYGFARFDFPGKNLLFLAPQRLTAPPDGRVGGPGHHVGRARHRRHVRSWPYTASPVTHVAGTPAAHARASRAWAHG
jgi:hypothetical protein